MYSQKRYINRMRAFIGCPVMLIVPAGDDMSE